MSGKKTFATLINEENEKKVASSSKKDGNKVVKNEKQVPGKTRSSFSVTKYDREKEYFRKSYGPVLCCILFGSVFTIITGTILLLSGYYYVPELEVQAQRNSTQSTLKSERHESSNIFNGKLKVLRITGCALLACGCFGSILLLLIPVICLGKNKYRSDDHFDNFPSTTNVRSITAISPHQRGVSLPSESSKYSIVKKHIQPRKNKQQHYRRLAKTDYDKGFLSPELNRGPIFVSDQHTSSLSSWNTSDDEVKRQRSKSDFQQLSPHHMFRIHNTVRYSTSLSHESLTTPKRCDSFNSLQ